MGYSARYHAYSLIAVFVALAIGIVIGAGFGQDVVSDTTKSLESSLTGDLTEARDEVERLRAELRREREVAERIYPALVGDRLREERVALIGLGALPEELARDVTDALEPTGATLEEVAVVRVPPDAGALARRLEKTRFARLRREPEMIENLGRVAGRQLAMGGALVRGARDQLLNRFSGRLGGVDHVILVRDPPKEIGSKQADAAERLESGLLDGLRGTDLRVVGVERTDIEESSVGLFDSHGIPTVDNLDLVSGRISMAFVLLGVEGNFGVKESADQLLPDLLRGSRGAGQRP